MAPERVSRRLRRARADVYGLGVTLYELLALQTPAVRRGATGCPPDRPHPVTPKPARRRDRLDPRLPRNLETIVHKAMEKDPRRRCQSAKELGNDLERSWPASRSTRGQSGWESGSARWAGRNPAVAGLTAAIFTVMAAGTLVSVTQAVRGRAESVLSAAAAEKAAHIAVERREAKTRAMLKFVEERVFAAARPRGQSGGLGAAVSPHGARVVAASYHH